MTSRGVFVAFEGGEGAGKSTQVGLLSQWLAQTGHQVTVTFEPGDTPLGRRLRELLLDPATGDLAPRAEALLYAADRAEHVATLVRPALEAGQWVITDRYLDSSIAYQGAGRSLTGDEVARLSHWATEELLPDLTVVLDIDPAVGLRRFQSPADRVESEPLDFHQRVREGFLELAAAEPSRYLVLDATRPVDDVHAAIRARVAELAG